MHSWRLMQNDFLQDLSQAKPLHPLLLDLLAAWNFSDLVIIFISCLILHQSGAP